MSTLVFLDTGPLGMVTNPRHTADRALHPLDGRTLNPWSAGADS